MWAFVACSRVTFTFTIFIIIIYSFIYTVSIQDNVLIVTEGLPVGQSGRSLILTTHCYLYLYSPTYIHGIHLDNMNIILCLCSQSQLLEGKTIPVQAWTGPEGSMKSRLPEFMKIWHMKIVRLSAVHTGRLYLPGYTPGNHSESTLR